MFYIIWHSNILCLILKCGFTEFLKTKRHSYKLKYRVRRRNTCSKHHKWHKYIRQKHFNKLLNSKKNVQQRRKIKQNIILSCFIDGSGSVASVFNLCLLHVARVLKAKLFFNSKGCLADQTFQLFSKHRSKNQEETEFHTKEVSNWNENPCWHWLRSGRYVEGSKFSNQNCLKWNEKQSLATFWIEIIQSKRTRVSREVLLLSWKANCAPFSNTIWPTGPLNIKGGSSKFS